VRGVGDGPEFLVEEIGPQLLDADQDLDDSVHVADIARVVKTNDPGLPSKHY
jgi:hypothetical protein